MYLYKSLFSFLVLRLQTVSCGGCPYYFFGLKSYYREQASQQNPTHMANKGKWGEKNCRRDKPPTLHTPPTNCTWREIPLNSSWQRQWAGRQIKQSPSRSPINTSHSLASLQTPPPPPPPPRTSLHAPTTKPTASSGLLQYNATRKIHNSYGHRQCVIPLLAP